MKTSRKSPLILLKLIPIILLQVAEAQKVQVLSEVTGYVGHNVTLPCHFIPGEQNYTFTQVQWELKPPEGEKLVIAVFNPTLGVHVEDTFLKERVEIAKQSLIIRRVELTDAGSYTCTITTYPSGVLEGTTNLIVQEKVLTSAVVSAIVISVLLLLVIMAAIAYFIFIRRPHSSVRHRVYIDTDGRVKDVLRPSFIVKEEEVVYSDVKLNTSVHAKPSSNDTRSENTHADDVTYSDVVVYRRPPR